MLNDLTPAEQRNIEGLKQAAESALSCDAQLTVPQAAVPWVIHACALALAAVPKIEWRDIVDEIDIQVGRQSNYGLLTLMAYKLYPDGEDTDPQWTWALEYDNDALVEGRTDTLEAAQAAAEAALLKLIGGTE